MRKNLSFRLVTTIDRKTYSKPAQNARKRDKTSKIPQKMKFRSY